MEQCEKWLNRDGVDILRPELRSWKGICSEDGFRKGWKASLECVRHTIIYESDGPSNPKDLMEWLNKELGYDG